MTRKDLLEIAANMQPWKGRHYLDPVRRVRCMEFAGAQFIWDPYGETWCYDDKEDRNHD